MYFRYRDIAVYGDENRALKLLISSVVFLFLATSAVALRFISRRVKRVGLAANDYWIIVALVDLVNKCYRALHDAHYFLGGSIRQWPFRDSRYGLPAVAPLNERTSNR